MPPKSTVSSSAPKPPSQPERGVAAAPGDLGAGAWGAVIASLVLVFALLFWLAAEPFDRSINRLEQWVGLSGDAAAEPSAGEDPNPGQAVAEPSESDPGDSGAEAPTAEPRVEQPRQPAWTLLDIEGAVSAMAPQIEGLIGEGRSELPEFRALSSSNATRAARAQESWAAWTRIWRNRVGQISRQLPPESACAVHAAMDPACRSLRSILGQLESVADAETLEDARQRFDGTAEALDLFVNPPEPEPEEEAESEEGEVAGET